MSDEARDLIANARDGPIMVVNDNPPPITPMMLLDKALDKGFDPEKLRALMELQQWHKKNEAAEFFAVQMTKFQSICQTVRKRRRATIKDNFSYAFASFDDVMAEVGPALAQCGIAVSFNTSKVPDAPALLRVVCTIRCGIHTQDTEMLLPIPQMTVNDTQKFGAAVSYGKRYALCAALNIVTTDRDDDAAGLVDIVTEDQVREMKGLFYAKAIEPGRVLKFLQIEELETMCYRDYVKTVDFLRRKETINKNPEPEEGSGSQ